MTARITDPDGLIAAAAAKYRGDPKYAPGQIVGGRLICGARKRNDDPCGGSPIKGGTRCQKHGASAKQVASKARERIIEQNARGILGRIDPTAPVENPVEMLLGMIRSKHAEVDWLRGRVQSLTEDDLVWGKAEHKVGQSIEGPVDVDTFKAEASVWYKLLREAENQLANWITMALKSGIEERRVRLAENQGAMVAGAVKAILDALHLSPEQLQQVPVIVPRELRMLSGEGS